MSPPVIEFQKVMTEVVFINLPAPDEPALGLTGMEILHGFLGEFYRSDIKEVKAFTDAMCAKWNIHFRVLK